MTDEEARLGGHIRYALVNPAVHTRPWQSGSIYLTYVGDQALGFLSISSSHLFPPSLSISVNIQLELSARIRRKEARRKCNSREEEEEVGSTHRRSKQ